MGAKLSRKRSEGGTAPEKNEGAEDSPVAKNVEQKPEDEVPERASEENKPLEEPGSSTGFLQTITQAVEETVNTVTEQISAPVEDVVNKGIKVVESAFAAINLNTKEPAAPEQEPEQIQESKPGPSVDLSGSGPADLLPESTVLDDLLKSQPTSEVFVPEVDCEVRVESETSQTIEDIINNPTQAENKDLLECLGKMATPSVDLLDCKMTHESTIPNSEPSVTVDDMQQLEIETMDLI